MATAIYFNGDVSRALNVEEEPSQVQDSWSKEGGAPFKLTKAGTDEEVWVNPASVAYWTLAVAELPGAQPSIARA